MLERIEEHRKAIEESSVTKTERMHKRGCENGGVASMTIAQDTFEGSEEFQGERAWILSVVDENRLVFV